MTTVMVTVCIVPIFSISSPSPSMITLRTMFQRVGSWGVHILPTAKPQQVAREGESYLFALMFLVRFCFRGHVGSFSFLNSKIDFLMSYLCVITKSWFLLPFFSSHINSRKDKRTAWAKPKQWRNAFSYYYQNKWRNCTPDGCTLSIQLKKCLVNRDKWSEMAEHFLAILKNNSSNISENNFAIFFKVFAKKPHLILIDISLKCSLAHS